MALTAFRIPQTAEEWAAVKPTNEECTLVEVWHRGAFGEEAYAPAVIHFARLAAVSRMVEHERCVERLGRDLVIEYEVGPWDALNDTLRDEWRDTARRILEDKP